MPPVSKNTQSIFLGGLVLISRGDKVIHAENNERYKTKSIEILYPKC